MASILALDATALAPVLEAAIQRLGELGPARLDAFNDLMASRSACADFDTGIDLLDGWIGEAGWMDETVIDGLTGLIG